MCAHGQCCRSTYRLFWWLNLYSLRILVSHRLSSGNPPRYVCQHVPALSILERSTAADCLTSVLLLAVFPKWHKCVQTSFCFHAVVRLYYVMMLPVLGKTDPGSPWCRLFGKHWFVASLCLNLKTVVCIWCASSLSSSRPFLLLVLGQLV